MRSLKLCHRCPVKLSSSVQLNSKPETTSSYGVKAQVPQMLPSGTLDPENVWQLELSEPPSAVLGEP